MDRQDVINKFKNYYNYLLNDEIIKKSILQDRSLNFEVAYARQYVHKYIQHLERNDNFTPSQELIDFLSNRPPNPDDLASFWRNLKTDIDSWWEAYYVEKGVHKPSASQRASTPSTGCNSCGS